MADIVWERFSAVENYIEPFFGSGAVLLGRPGLLKGLETINDIDGYIVNFWRAIADDPEAVASHADQPVFESEMHARHTWLLERRATLLPQLEGDPHYYDAKIAGWWVWGLCCWIGAGWCSGKGPWKVKEGMLVKEKRAPASEEVPDTMGITRGLPFLGHGGKGVVSARVLGINRQIPLLSSSGMGILTGSASIHEWFGVLANRMKRVRICAGDWERICGPAVTYGNGVTGVLLDPPYGDEAVRAKVYTEDDFQVSTRVRQWAIANGDHPLMRIALCGYEGEHEMPASWEKYAWNAGEGYGGQNKGERTGNGKKERIWFSPHCKKSAQGKLF